MKIKDYFWWYFDILSRLEEFILLLLLIMQTAFAVQLTLDSDPARH